MYEEGVDTTWEQVQADTLVGLITGARTLERRVPEVSVLIDLDTLKSGRHHQSVCETADGNPLRPDTVRPLGGDADLLSVVSDGHGEVLDVGREQRLATRAQRAMYRTCAHPRCQVRFDACRIHHVHWWDNHGPAETATT